MRVKRPRLSSVPFSGAAAASAMLLWSASATAQQQWQTFRSYATGITLQFPTHLLVQKGSHPASGRYVLRGDAVLILNRSEIGGESLERFLRRNLLRGIRVTYTRRKGDWYAYSGYAGDYIVYGRSELSCGGRFAHSFMIRYPTKSRATYDPVVERLSRSLAVSRASPPPGCR